MLYFQNLTTIVPLQAEINNLTYKILIQLKAYLGGSLVVPHMNVWSDIPSAPSA